MLSIPIATHCELFEWQLDLFWYCHRRIYGPDAVKKARAVVIKRNTPDVEKVHRMRWNIGIPHTMCEAFFDLKAMKYSSVALPLNIQIGVAQILPSLSDDVVLEIIDCDMFHLRRSPELQPGNSELFVSTVYEDWHLFSRTTNRSIIEPYFENSGRFYNGGFVPIIGKVATFKRIMREWIAIHVDILTRPFDESIHWWAGMFALQAACEKARVRMIDTDCCYIPGANTLSSKHHIAHYSVDTIFDKRSFPKLNLGRFDLRNPFYNLIREWLDQKTL
jgi:hypothetical protein